MVANHFAPISCLTLNQHGGRFEKCESCRQTSSRSCRCSCANKYTTTPNTRPTNDHTSTSTVLTSANSPAASSSRSSGSSLSNFNNYASNNTTNEALRNFAYGSRPTPRDTQYRPPPKRVCQTKGRENTRPKETWTHEVFCLGNVDENATPTRERKKTLQLAGLGSKIKFDANSNAIEFKKKLEEVFPKLILGGGFELLRRSSSGSLVVLRQPACGYSVKYLRESSGFGQALIYSALTNELGYISGRYVRKL